VATITEPVPTQARPSRPVWTLVKVLVFIALALVVVQVAASHRDELTGTRRYLEDLNWAWIGVAIAAETGSMLAFTALQRRLLLAGGLDVRMRPLVAITLAGNAMANSLPAGGAFATVFAYRQYRQKGADEALAAWTLVAVTCLTAVTLATLAVVGAVIAGDQGSVSGLAPLIALLLVGPAAGLTLIIRPLLLVPIGVPPLRLARWLTGRPRQDPVEMMTNAARRLAAVAPKLPDWAVCVGWASCNWAADLGCLIAAFHAVGAPVPARALLLAYGAAQVAANLPITPGGLGVVEGSLAVALVAFGGSTEATVAAVLLYRILSFWVLLPIGWAAWGGLRWQARRAERAAVS